MQTSPAHVVLPNLSQHRPLLFYLNYTGLPVNSRITFKLARLTYKLLTTGQPAPCGRLSWLPVSFLLHVKYTLSYRIVICTCYYTITALHALYGRLINFSSTCRDFPLNLVKDHLVTGLLQFGMDNLLTSDFHPLLTPSNAV